jgi:ABC-2 type transport system ATP-binding protein
MDEADRIADRVAIIDSGKLLRLDTPDNLKRSIGEGDILEMRLGGYDPGSDKAEEHLKSLGLELTRWEDGLAVRSRDVVSRILEIHQVLQKEKIEIREMKIRQNTLEDVFIHLTGKSLRA